ncbi:MAG TPA: hypothetical protein VFH91_10185 [Pyrinomonadaceae bacterium]|nr:hypothetical protein [Pyrinomonadaceae bacterium]
MPAQADFDSTFEQLKKIFEPYRSRLIVSADNSSLFTLEVDHVMKNKHRLYFGGVRRGKAYVSFHLMPVYACPEVQSQISPELKKRMQGKSCFNFSYVDAKLFKELAKLTKAGFKRFTNKEFYSQF